MNDIDRGQVINFTEKVEEWEKRADEIFAGRKRNPSLELIQRADQLGLTSWDVRFTSIRAGVEVARIPGDDRMAFVFFLDRPDSKPPSAS